MRADQPPQPFEIGRDGPSVLLVGVDGSPTSLRAAAYAAGLARRQSSRLAVVHVRTSPTLTGLSAYAAPYIDASTGQLADDLHRQVEAAAAYVGIETEWFVAKGDPYSEITRIATEIAADAVLVGASASAGHKLVGSLAVRLVRAGKWPVTVVP
jgi:nucleotide-binding universal stress UspA family protein